MPESDIFIMLHILRTSPANEGYNELVTQLDAELAITDGDDHAFYDQFNKSDNIKHVVVFYENDHPVGCGAIKEFEPKVMEVKRMFVKKDSRGNGYASLILKELESWADELGYKKCILETGINQPEAIALYKKSGYKIIPNYGQYEGVEKSFCFGKNF